MRSCFSCSSIAEETVETIEAIETILINHTIDTIIAGLTTDTTASFRRFPMISNGL